MIYMMVYVKNRKENIALMNTFINLLESLFAISLSIWGILFLTGKIGYSGDKEMRRIERVKKYKIPLIIGIVFSLLGGIGLLVTAL